MKRLIAKALPRGLPVLALAVLFLPAPAMAAGGHGAVLDEVEIGMGDKESLRRGASLFVDYCLSCHSASYMRYERMAEDLDIPLEELEQDYMYTTDKVGDLMLTTMSQKDGQAWFGVAPPDLTLVSRVRKPNWIYTYLRAFYLDEKSPSGWNNSLFENVAMPHVLYELQGAQRLVGKVAHSEDQEHESAGGEAGPETRVVGDAVFELAYPGSRTPEEFDSDMRDLTNFLAYMAEPAQLKRKKIGIYTLAFLLLMLIVTWLLKKEYWRDIH